MVHECLLEGRVESTVWKLGRDVSLRNGLTQAKIGLGWALVAASGWIGALGCDILRPIQQPKMEILNKNPG